MIGSAMSLMSLAQAAHYIKDALQRIRGAMVVLHVRAHLLFPQDPVVKKVCGSVTILGCVLESPQRLRRKF